MQKTKRKKKQYGKTKKKQVKRTIKDSLFRFLFEKDKETLLQLYNALNSTDYCDASELQVVTIENAVYVTMKNDLAFVIAGTLNLYEHQSTFNPNMPVRFMIYLAKEYQTLVEQAESSLYGTKQITLPTPQCIVFYNGETEMPEETQLKLSDAFDNKKKEADIELKVRMLNINHGHNEELMRKCKTLKEYAEFVDISRIYIKEKAERNEALNQAIDYCITHDILSDFLKKYRVEVLGMLLEEFDAKKYERTIRQEGREQGRKEAMELTCILISQNRIEDLQRAAQEPDYQRQLLEEFNLIS